MKILICGLPGSGKTTLAKEFAYKFNVPHHNADFYREAYKDWDFSDQGRERQAIRMSKKIGILDFVCPTEKLRKLVDANYIIWLNTIEKGRYEDTNKIFEPPKKINFEIKKWIGKNQLHNSWEDFSPGMKGIQSYLDEQFHTQAK